MARPATDLNDVKAVGGREKRPRPADLVNIYKFPEKKWVTIRLIGPLFAYGGYWIQTKKRDGALTAFYTEAPSFNPATRERDSTIYDPWRDAQAYLQEQAQASGKKRDPAKKPLVSFSVAYFGNIIVRSEEKKMPERIRPTAQERKSGFKDKDSDTPTPVFAARFTANVANKIKELQGLNTRTSKASGETKSYPVSDEKRGMDIRVFYDSTKAPADQYQIVPGDKVALSEEELAYLRWDCSDLAAPDDEAETRTSFARWIKTMEIDMPTAKTKKTRDADDELDTKRKKRRTDDEDEDFDDEDDGDSDFDDDDDDDEPAPKSKKKPATKAKPSATKKSRRSSDDEDEDDEDDFDSDDEDEDDEDDDEPAPKSKKKVPVKSKAKRRSSADDDEDEEDDDLDDDEDDDEPAPKSKKKAPAKKAPAKRRSSADDDEEDDDLDDEDEDDEDDEPAPKSKKKTAAKSAPKGKKKPVYDDFDDEDEESNDEDDDDDDEPAPKSKKKAPAKKPVAKAKKKPADDDDFDDDDEDLDEDFDEDDDDDEPAPKAKRKTRR